MRDRALALGLVKKGRGRSESIALAEGIESSSRYQTPAVPVSKSRCTAKAETSAIDFKACQQGTFANGCAKKYSLQMGCNTPFMNFYRFIEYIQSMRRFIE